MTDFASLIVIAKPRFSAVVVDELHVNYADYLAVHIEQAAAGVTAVDRRIRLDSGNAVVVVNLSVQTGNNALGNGCLKTERVAYYNNIVAEAQLVGVAQCSGGEVAVGLDLQHCEVGVGVGA